MTDKVYKNGKIYTVNVEQPWAEAVAIKDGVFIKVGSNADVQPLIETHTEVVDLEGQFVMPGIYEMHVHATQAALREMRECQFSQFATQDEIRSAIKRYATAHPGNGWIWGGGYGSDVFPEANPHKSFLDQILPDRPAFISDETFHNVLANSKALELAGINKNTKDPEGGIIERDPETGEPTGTLRENACLPLLEFIPEPPPEVLEKAALISAERLSAFGVVELKMAEGDEPQINAWRAVDGSGGGLPIRVNFQVGSGEGAPNSSIANFDKMISLPDDYRSKNVRIHGVKIFLDGVPMGMTAVMLEPYLDSDGVTGEFLPSVETLEQDVILYDKMGLSVMMHCCGDATVRRALNAVEAARKANGPDGPRHQIAHTSLTHPDDVPRFKELNVIAEFGPPIWFPHPMLESFRHLVGEDRMRERFMPTKSFVDKDATIVWGSDWPASVPDANPWTAMESLITRANPWGEYPGETLYPEERVDLAEAIKIFTINGAWSLNREYLSGSIQEGKLADMIVLDRNLFEVPVESIGGTQVKKTVFEGNTVYET